MDGFKFSKCSCCEYVAKPRIEKRLNYRVVHECGVCGPYGMSKKEAVDRWNLLHERAAATLFVKKECIRFFNETERLLLDTIDRVQK